MFIHCTYSVHTSAFMFILCTYKGNYVYTLYIHSTNYSISVIYCTYIVHTLYMLFPLFLAGNTTPTIPHVFSKRKDSGFPMGCADAAALDGRRGSNVYEVNTWLWQFGRGKPRLGGLTVEETADRQLAKVVDRKKRAAETRRRRKADRA